MFCLLGNKCDVSSEEIAEVGEFLSQNPRFLFQKVSAKTGENVPEVFEKITKKLLENDNGRKLVLDVGNLDKKRKQCC